MEKRTAHGRKDISRFVLDDPPGPIIYGSGTHGSDTFLDRGEQSVDEQFQKQITNTRTFNRNVFRNTNVLANQEGSQSSRNEIHCQRIVAMGKRVGYQDVERFDLGWEELAWRSRNPGTKSRHWHYKSTAIRQNVRHDHRASSSNE